MSPLSVILLVITGLAGVYLFLSTGGEQRAEHQEARTRHQLAAERFDQDFESAMAGQGIQADPHRAARIEALEADLAEREARRKAAEAEARKAEADLLKGIQDLTNTPKPEKKQ